MLDTTALEQIRSITREALAQTNLQKTVYLQDLKHPELRLTRPLPVFLETDGQGFIANYYDTESFGLGDSEYEALDDLCVELTQTYLDLELSQNHLGPLPTRWWAHLQTIIQRRSDATQET